MLTPDPNPVAQNRVGTAGPNQNLVSPDREAPTAQPKQLANVSASPHVDCASPPDSFAAATISKLHVNQISPISNSAALTGASHQKTILYATTTIARLQEILASGRILPSRLGTAISDHAIEIITDTDQRKGRSITEPDRKFHAALTASGGSWLRIWGSTKRPSEMCALEMKLLGVKTAEEVTIGFEVEQQKLLRPEPWKSAFIQPSVRFLPGADGLTVDSIKHLIVYSPQHQEQLSQLVQQCSPHITVERENIGERSRITDTLQFVARPASYLLCGGYLTVVAPALTYFGCDGLAPEIATFASGTVIMATAATAVNDALLKTTIKTHCSNLISMLHWRNLISVLQDDSAGRINVPRSIAEIKIGVTKGIARFFFGREAV